MARLFLHGGAPKTGTSAIQVLLARHAEALAERGVVYPEGHLFEAARRGQVTAGNGLAMANYLNPDLPQHQGRAGYGSSSPSWVLRGGRGPWPPLTIGRGISKLQRLR